MDAHSLDGPVNDDEQPTEGRAIPVVVYIGAMILAFVVLATAGS